MRRAAAGEMVSATRATLARASDARAECSAPRLARMAFGFRSDRARDEEARRQVDARVEDAVPAGMRIAGAWSWRLLALAGVIALLLFLIVQLRLIVIPIMVALLLAALLVPFSNLLQRHRWPKWLAIAVSEVGILAILGGLIWLTVATVRAGAPVLVERSRRPLGRPEGLAAGVAVPPVRGRHQRLGGQLPEVAPERHELAVVGCALGGLDRRPRARRLPARALRDPLHPHRRSRHLALDRAHLPAQVARRGARRRARPAGSPCRPSCGCRSSSPSSMPSASASVPSSSVCSTAASRCVIPIAIAGLPRLVHPRRRRRGVRGARRLHRARLPRAGGPRSSCC